MKNKQLFLSMLLVGMSFGTAWAIRGQFGHEQGATWAAAIGSLSILLVAKRSDWLNKAFAIVIAGAVGWGLGGMISYGMVIGYGRGSDFVNVYYGLLMLFLIGGLYGIIGGGMFGLALSDTSKNRVNWRNLIVEMVVGGLIFYFFMIEQFGWFMTPPRSEAWALCFGFAVAIVLHMIRNKQYSALRVAAFAGLGGGFGFSFGNLLQVLGIASGIEFNFWNVMEYSIGFFGGLGMAYGTFTSTWEEDTEPKHHNAQLFPLLAIVLIVPIIVWQQSFESERILKMLDKIIVVNSDLWFSITRWGSLILVLIIAVIFYRKLYINKGENVPYSYTNLLTFFAGIFGVYMVLSWLITGAFISTYRIEQYLYLMNFALILSLIGRAKAPFKSEESDYGKWFRTFIALVALVSIFAVIAMNSHEEMKNAKKRFGNETELTPE